MKTTEVKTSELIGAALDWAVAVADGNKAILMPLSGNDYEAGVIDFSDDGNILGIVCQYSTDCSQGGPLIEKYSVILAYHNAPDRIPIATTIETNPDYEFGPTLLIAAMRAIVAAKLGDVVSVPVELVEEVK